MNFYKNQFSKWIKGLAVMAILIPTIAIGATLVVSLDCGSEDTEEVEANLSGHTVSARDTASATNAYAIWAGGQSGVSCNSAQDCAPSSCIPYVIGFGATGSYPTPNHNKTTGTFRFPAYNGDVEVRCDCYTDAKTIFDFEIFEGGFFPFEPIIDNEDDNESEIRNRNEEEKINIYPNPAKNRLNLDFKDFTIEGDFTIAVYDELGRVIETRNIEVSDYSSKFFDIQISDYQSGIYYLSISDTNGIVSKSKFIVAEQ